MTRDQLTALTRKQLVEIARKKRVDGFSGMRKAELIEALAAQPARRSGRSAKNSTRSASPKGESSRSTSRASNGKLNPRSSSKRSSNGSSAPKAKSAASPRKSKTVAAKPKSDRKLLGTNGQVVSRDILEVDVLDPRWLHIRWRIRRQTLDRAQTSLGVEWHSARPVLRIFDVTDNDKKSVSRSHVEDVDIDAQADHWYTFVRVPGRDYRMHLGFLTNSGRFLALARSTRYHVPSAGNSDDSRRTKTRKGVEDNASRTFATIDELTNVPRLKAPIITSVSQQNETSNGARNDWGGFEFSINAEATIFGRVASGAQLTILDEAIPLASDGSFAVRVGLPEGRQVLPTVAVSPDGNEVRTIVLALERNTKELEPQLQDEPDF